MTADAGAAAGPRGLRAACALAAFDPDNPRWAEIREAVVSELVRSRTVDVGFWQAALSPVGRHLAEPLAEASHDAQLGPTERSTATDLAVDYAAELPKVLADGIQYADDKQFSLFFEPLQHRAQEAARELVPLLQAEPQFDWKDAPLDAKWKTPDATVVERLVGGRRRACRPGAAP